MPPERERVRENMIAKSTVMRDIARGIDLMAQEANAAGDWETAATMLRALKRFGAANRGPEVTKLIDLVGRAIEDLADRGLSRLN